MLWPFPPPPELPLLSWLELPWLAALAGFECLGLLCDEFPCVVACTGFGFLTFGLFDVGTGATVPVVEIVGAVRVPVVLTGSQNP